MVGIANIQNQKPHLLTISRAIFTALSPLDQVAARALVRCELAQIVDENEVTSTR
jgi:hypothetical protein